jgi:uncharacterized protein (TIGR00369 family)
MGNLPGTAGKGFEMKSTKAKKERTRKPPVPDIRGGDPALPARRGSESQVRLAVLTNPEQANSLGDVHGGVIMKLVDEAGALSAMRHARQVVVTVAMDSITFLSPVHVGDLVTLNASVNYVGRSSLEVGIRVEAENVLTGQATHTNSAYAVYVALDSSGRPTPVPPLLLESDAERRRWNDGAARQAHRLEQAKRKNSLSGPHDGP